MVTEDRDPAFWCGVYEHPSVKPHVGLGRQIEIAEIVADQRVTPLRATHGGFLFIQLDGLGRIYELHTMFTPEGWGREVLHAAKAAFCMMFERGADLITTFEVAGHKQSQPPRTFRFEPAGAFAFEASLNAELRTWALRRQAWEESPARQRMTQCP